MLSRRWDDFVFLEKDQILLLEVNNLNYKNQEMMVEFCSAIQYINYSCAYMKDKESIIISLKQSADL